MFFTGLVSLWCWASSVVTSSPAPNRPNILLIISDDYKPEGRIGIDGHPGGPLFNTPNLNKLASQSIVFDAAFSESPSCGPSRSSFLTGFNNDRLQYWSFVSKHWRKSGTAWMSLPQYFRTLGYRTIGIGKVFHWDDVYGDDAQFSWDVSMGTGAYSAGETKCARDTDFFCPCTAEGCADSNLANDAIMQLNSLCSTPAHHPWFLALGFRRPHMDWNLPPGWLQANGLDNVTIPLPINREMDPSIPDQAFYACDTLLTVPGQNTLPQGAHFSDDFTTKIRRYYWSTVKYMDAQLGRVLTHFDKFPKVVSKTIVVFISDHGWSLGEKGLFCKQNLFDDATRVAMMYRIPWKSSGGTRSMRPVSLLDLFPTLVDVANVENPIMFPCFSGKSVFNDTSDEAGVISMFPRCAAAADQNPYSNPCMNEFPSNFKVMGYTLRTSSYRYTEWRRWIGTQTIADWSPSGLLAVELYDNRLNTFSPSDAVKFEIKNVAEAVSFAQTRINLAAQLRSRVNNPSWTTRCVVTAAPTSKQASTHRATKSPTCGGWRKHSCAPTLPPSLAPINKQTSSPSRTPDGLTSRSPTTTSTHGATNASNSTTTGLTTTPSVAPSTVASPTNNPVSGSPTTAPTPARTDSPSSKHFVTNAPTRLPIQLIQPTTPASGSNDCVVSTVVLVLSMIAMVQNAVWAFI